MNKNIKPFIKFVGGKKQLIPEINNNIPDYIKSDEEFTYIEPFVGGGAILFYMLKTYKNIKKAVIIDINEDLIKTYNIVKNNPIKLCNALSEMNNEYYSMIDDESKKSYFLRERERFNQRNLSDVENAAKFIFLNKTGFNGLYRVNSKNKFNVPFGRIINPKIFDLQTIIETNKVLQKVEIINGDFEKSFKFANKNSFFYFDPPYKPLNKTSSFTKYNSNGFDDVEQVRLKNFCDKIDDCGFDFLLSNSDLKNIDEDNNFFDELYKEYKIIRVSAKRSINSNGNKRGNISELLIKNY